MEYIHFEAEVDNPSNYDNTLNSDNEKVSKDNDFINDLEEIVDDVSLNRKRNPCEREDYNKFPDQTRNPISAVFEDNELFLKKLVHSLSFICLWELKMQSSIISVGMKKLLKNFIVAFEILRKARTRFLIV